MSGFVALVLHAHLPFVRHPEHEKSLEETWLFEAITETYLPLLRVMEGWRRDGVAAPLTLTLSPTLCAMLRDPFLQARYAAHLAQLTELAGKEVRRTAGSPAFHDLAKFYLERLDTTRRDFESRNGDLVAGFRALQDEGRLEIITTAATHAFLPLLLGDAPALRGQIRTACDDYRECFGRAPRGIWLPECAYDPALEACLREAGLRWFGLDSHGLLNATPRPRYTLYAPVVTPQGLAAFGRDPHSARQVWSRQEGYPGDPHYRDFYRDIGYDLELDYVQPHLPCEGVPGFTGLKYHRVTGSAPDKAVYHRPTALASVERHADHFLQGRQGQIRRLAAVLGRPPLVFCPYDAELFGHWWYEGPEFLDRFARKAAAGRKVFELITPAEFLRRHPTHQAAAPTASSWGQDGYWRAWLNEKNHWVQPRLRAAQRRMTALAGRFTAPDPRQARALRQAARELLLAQSSDWLFILHTGTSPAYATRRVEEHLGGFQALHDQLVGGTLEEETLARLEARHNLFPRIDWRHWSASGTGGG